MGKDKICGRNRKQGRGQCNRPAGWGTDHPGDGACKLHGGNSARGKKNGNYKHGLYSKHIREEVEAEFRAWQEQCGTQHDRLSDDDEFLIFLLTEALIAAQTEEGSKLPLADRAALLNQLMDIRLKAQKLRGGEQQQSAVVVLEVPVVPIVRPQDGDATADPPAS